MTLARSPRNGRRTFAVVPMKTLAQAKQRLSTALPADLRRRLVVTMLEDVLGVLMRVQHASDSTAIERIIVVTRDAEIATIASGFGAQVLGEPDSADMNQSIAFGLAQAHAEGAERGLIVPGDVPLVTVDEIERVLAAASTADAVVIAPARDGDGTNTMLLPLPAPFELAFGPASAGRHTGLARIGGRRLVAVGTAGLAHDIDTAADLAALVGMARYAFLDPAFGGALSPDAAHDLITADLPPMMARAEAMTVAAHGTVVTFSKKVFIPLTKLCRDVCHYCTFAHAPRELASAYLSPDEVLAIARAGKAQGCKEALFTLGDKPELRYAAAREALAKLGYATTLAYLEAMAALVLKETGLLPHLNPGAMSEAEIRRLREVSVSLGLMLETTSARLSEKGGPHHGSPDKDPAVRIATLEAAGRATVPLTTGILIGIGETRPERIEALLAIRDVHRQFGHIQEVIVQNFRAKPDTKMASAREPSLDEHLWTIAAARLILGPAMNIQAPPNLQDAAALASLVRAGINDWGGVSPVTPDHVNPERPWPQLDALAAMTEAAGRTLAERTAAYPAYALDAERWIAKPLRTPLLRLIDAAGRAREDDWAPGDATHGPPPRDAALVVGRRPARTSTIAATLDRLVAGRAAGEGEIAALFMARGDDFSAICAAADDLRRRRNGDAVTYVVNRNINYTNICTYGCKFCAFSKGRLSTDHRDKPYNLELEEVAERTREAWARGATEVCLQGGIAPRYTGDTYIAIAEAVKIGAPDIHVHAFSPLEVWHGATTLKLPLREYLARLKSAGLSSLPGTAAEILDDEVRQVLCPDKITTDQWLEVMEAAHSVDLKSTATIMFGHVDHPRHWVRHLMRVRGLQERTGGFTELVPLAFVHMESPIYLRGQSRKGPTFREGVLMHAVARLVLDPLITNIQASWVKMGPEGAKLCLAAGCNDVGGTLMNESITRAAGAAFGQEMTPAALEALIIEAGRVPRRRSTFYGEVAAEHIGGALAEARPTARGILAAE